MQQDAEEAFSILLQSMQDVPGTKGKSIVEELFQGEFLVTSKCVESPEEPQEVGIEPFQKLSVHIEADTSFLQTAIKNVRASLPLLAISELRRDPWGC